MDLGYEVKRAEATAREQSDSKDGLEMLDRIEKPAFGKFLQNFFLETAKMLDDVGECSTSFYNLHAGVILCGATQEVLYLGGERRLEIFLGSTNVLPDTLILRIIDVDLTKKEGAAGNNPRTWVFEGATTLPWKNQTLRLYADFPTNLMRFIGINDCRMQVFKKGEWCALWENGNEVKWNL